MTHSSTAAPNRTSTTTTTTTTPTTMASFASMNLCALLLVIPGLAVDAFHRDVSTAWVNSGATLARKGAAGGGTITTARAGIRDTASRAPCSGLGATSMVASSAMKARRKENVPG